MIIGTILRGIILTALVGSLALVFFGEAHGATGSVIKLKVDGVNPTRGTLRAALVNSKEAYTEDGQAVMVQSVPVRQGQEEVVFQNVPFGTYAIKVFYDENDNSELDTNFIGIPTEKYGFSNNARSKLGLPDFEKVKFQVNAPEVKLDIAVEHY